MDYARQAHETSNRKGKDMNLIEASGGQAYEPDRTQTIQRAENKPCAKTQTEACTVTPINARVRELLSWQSLPLHSGG